MGWREIDSFEKFWIFFFLIERLLFDLVVPEKLHHTSLEHPRYRRCSIFRTFGHNFWPDQAITMIHTSINWKWRQDFKKPTQSCLRPRDFEKWRFYGKSGPRTSKNCFFVKIMNIHEYLKTVGIIQCKTTYLLKLWNKKSEKFHRTLRKFKIPFLEHSVLEASRQHQPP